MHIYTHKHTYFFFRSSYQCPSGCAHLSTLEHSSSCLLIVFLRLSPWTLSRSSCCELNLLPICASFLGRASRNPSSTFSSLPGSAAGRLIHGDAADALISPLTCPSAAHIQPFHQPPIRLGGGCGTTVKLWASWRPPLTDLPPHRSPPSPISSFTDFPLTILPPHWPVSGRLIHVSLSSL